MNVITQAKTGRHLILHAGLPKTGTSALQRALWSNRGTLASRGVLYPDDVVLYRHQSFLRALIGGVPFEPPWRMTGEYARHDVVLSSEGLSNHFDDIPGAGHAVLRELGAEFDHRTIYLATRDPHAWTLSYYKQCLINPRMPTMPVYATTARYDEFTRLPRVRRLAEAETLLGDMQRATGFDVVRVDYDAAGVGKLYQDLAGCEPPDDLDTRVNASLPDAAAEIARRINERFGDMPRRANLITLLRGAVTAHFEAETDTHEPPPLAPEDLASLHLGGSNPPLKFDPAEIDAIIARMRERLAVHFKPGVMRRCGVPATE